MGRQMLLQALRLANSVEKGLGSGQTPHEALKAVCDDMGLTPFSREQIAKALKDVWAYADLFEAAP